MEEWKKYGFKSKLEMNEIMSEIWYNNEKLLEEEIEKRNLYILLIT